MGVPLRQMLTVGAYLARQRLSGRTKFPLIVELEPLFACNLACAGCGKIQHPTPVLKRRMSVDDAVAAIEECGAPMVSIAGGEPLVHPEIDGIVNALLARKKFVYLSTNGILLRKKLGLFAAEDDDAVLAKQLMDVMAAGKADFTLTFRGLSEMAADPSADAKVRALFDDPAAFDGWAAEWRSRLAREGGDPSARAAAMKAVNPAFIPRNHLVEEALSAAVDGGDLAPFEKLLRVLARPFEDQPDVPEYALPPRPEQVVRATFCGT